MKLKDNSIEKPVNRIKWYDEIIVENIIDKRTEKYGLTKECICPEKSLDKMTVQELREYITFFCEKGFYSALYSIISYEEENQIRNDLNNEFDRRCGNEFISLYNIIDKKRNNEKWNGDERYKLLTLTNRKGYGEMQTAKGVVKLLEIKNNKNYTELVESIIDISNNLPYWGFDFEKGNYSLDIDNPNDHKKLNESRKNEIQAQDNFINSILINN